MLYLPTLVLLSSQQLNFEWWGLLLAALPSSMPGFLGVPWYLYSQWFHALSNWIRMDTCLHAPFVREWISQNVSYYTGSAPLMDSMMVFLILDPDPEIRFFLFLYASFRILSTSSTFFSGIVVCARVRYATTGQTSALISGTLRYLPLPSTYLPVFAFLL